MVKRLGLKGVSCGGKGREVSGTGQDGVLVAEIGNFLFLLYLATIILVNLLVDETMLVTARVYVVPVSLSGGVKADSRMRCYYCSQS